MSGIQALNPLDSWGSMGIDMNTTDTFRYHKVSALLNCYLGLFGLSGVKYLPFIRLIAEKSQ